VFVANRTHGHGGAVYCTASSPAIRDCVFEDNESMANSEASGAALSIWGPSSPEITRCTFLRNRARRGGGAIGFYGSARSVLTDCVFLNNEAIRVGGGDIECTSTAAPMMVQCTFYGGSAPAGGSFSNKDRSHPTLEKCIIAFCAQGEAIECKDTSQATLHCCSLYGNAGGDWVGCIEAQQDVAGNCSVAPEFTGPERGDVSLGRRSKLRDRKDCGMLGARPESAR
jgi:hypothetical protein